MSTFYYSLIKCTPDIKRQETINIGVVVFHSTRLDVRLLQSASKLQLFATDTIRDALTDIKERYTFFSKHADTPEEKHSALSMFNDDMMRLGGLGFFMAADEKAYETTLRKLLDTLVEPQKVGKANHRPQFALTLKHLFEELNLLGKDERDILKHKVVPNFMIDPELDIKGEFMLKNGIYHLTETLDFNTQNSLSEKRKQAAYKLLTFDRADKVLGGIGSDVARYFVYAANNRNESNAKALLDLMEDNNAATFNWESTSDRAAYTDLIMTHAGMTH